MTDTRKTQATIRRLEQVKTWQLVVLLILAGFVSATFLRLNNIGMIERRDAVLAADKEGDTVILAQRLYDLQRYAAAHMNADTGRVPLDHSYKQAYERELKRFSDEVRQRANNDVVLKVREVCDGRARAGGYGHFWTHADPRYVACINDEWAKYPVASVANLHFTPPITDPYYQTFLSPAWSSDFAGWSVLVTGVIALTIILRLLVAGVLRAIIWRRSRQF